MGRVTLAVRLKPEANREGEHVVRIRITKDRLVVNWSLNIAVPEKHFNLAGNSQQENWIRRANHSHGNFNKRILVAYEQAREAVAFFEKRASAYTANDVRDYLERGGLPDTVLSYFSLHLQQRVVAAGDDLSKIQTTGGYKDTLKVLRWYLRETNQLPDSIPDEVVDKRFWLLSNFAKKDILDLKDWLSNNYGENTVSTHLSKLRHVLFLAADAGLISYEKFPMRGVSISFKRKKVDRLREDDIEQLATARADKKNRGGGAHFVTNPVHARSLAMMMYLAHGARLSDAVSWRMKDYVIEGQEHRLRYQTGKNKRTLSVLLDQEAIDLLAPYRIKSDGSLKQSQDFLFPYLPANWDKLSAEDKHIELRKAKGRARHQITQLGLRIGLDKHLTPHVMRHSFADMMRKAGVPLETRQEALGHSDIKTTRNYEDQFDQEAVDKVSMLYQNRRNKKEENTGKTEL
ncbi:tyrosine-type recombinase/integrase [Spirosoma sp. HMF4905]|uniref:Tyrosine-type recombinase/integrase n=1 Tax=Spirosoma arboris TaxID=2682092 RepID=A0A7K1SKE6_9BACT|nr:tyrosine-type recombinase/integrase [Spirosoma arboris]MVM34270.1 tyrosine-type recombinase/integrase [Spirosoma arboris]